MHAAGGTEAAAVQGPRRPLCEEHGLVISAGSTSPRWTAPNREQAQPTLPGLFQLKRDQAASVLAAGMKGDRLPVTPLGWELCFPGEPCQDRRTALFFFLGPGVSPERRPRDAGPPSASPSPRLGARPHTS